MTEECRPYRKFFFCCFSSIFTLLFVISSALTSGCDGGGDGGEDGEPPPSAVTENKLNLEILDATISPDRSPIVTFRLTDDRENPIDTDGVSMNWIISRIEGGESIRFVYTATLLSKPIRILMSIGIIQEISS